MCRKNKLNGHCLYYICTLIKNYTIYLCDHKHLLRYIKWRFICSLNSFIFLLHSPNYFIFDCNDNWLWRDMDMAYFLYMSWVIQWTTTNDLTSGFTQNVSHVQHTCTNLEIVSVFTYSKMLGFLWQKVISTELLHSNTMRLK